MRTRSLAALAAVLCLIALAGCGWVDDITGNDTNDDGSSLNDIDINIQIGQPGATPSATPVIGQAAGFACTGGTGSLSCTWTPATVSLSVCAFPQEGQAEQPTCVQSESPASITPAGENSGVWLVTASTDGTTGGEVGRATVDLGDPV